jgi:SAM-dependent methyltransferase
MKIGKSIANVYNQLSNYGKIMLFLVLFLILVIIFKGDKWVSREGYENNNNIEQKELFVFKDDVELYDEFYADIYDFLVYSNIKTDYEVGAIIDKTAPTERSIILDVGSGTGHHLAKLAEHKFRVVGIDTSPAMVSKAKENYPDYTFIVGDVLNNSQFPYNTFTHIICMYFTIYYFKDKQLFFNNCKDWLIHDGHLIVHLVEREKFDPMLPTGNPLYIVSPQKYAKERITKTKITFDKFVYESNFELNKETNVANFIEKFKFNDGKTRKQEHTLYMEPHEQIVQMAQNAGFIIKGVVDLVYTAYEYQYLYIFVKA